MMQNKTKFSQPPTQTITIMNQHPFKMRNKSPHQNEEQDTHKTKTLTYTNKDRVGIIKICGGEGRSIGDARRSFLFK